MALQSLESAKDDIKSARQELDNARVSFLKKSWVYLTSLILILIYVALLLVGFIWAFLGTDQIALSVNRDGISSILGDILPKNPLKVSLSFLLFEIIYFTATIALLIIFLIFSFVLSLIFGGLGDLSLSVSKLPPSFVIELIILVVLIEIILLVRWPSTFFILDGKSPLATLKESILFFRQHWQKILLLKLSKNITLFTIIFYFLLYLGSSIGIPILREEELEKILRGVSVELSPLVVVIAFAVLWVLLCYLTVMEAQLYILIRKEEETVSPSAHALGEGAGSTVSSSMSE
ncbi:MAG: hypothetical protein RMJ66_06545 [Bacteroidia bacterium]|nr:hypothetical protein [Bacteroidia bacterium]MDW8134710.1 hypothetical protein [Bacteroidia bacterium]